MELTNHKVESFVRGSIICACTECYLSKIQYILVPKPVVSFGHIVLKRGGLWN